MTALKSTILAYKHHFKSNNSIVKIITVWSNDRQVKIDKHLKVQNLLFSTFQNQTLQKFEFFENSKRCSVAWFYYSKIIKCPETTKITNEKLREDLGNDFINDFSTTTYTPWEYTRIKYQKWNLYYYLLRFIFKIICYFVGLMHVHRSAPFDSKLILDLKFRSGSRQM